MQCGWLHDRPNQSVDRLIALIKYITKEGQELPLPAEEKSNCEHRICRSLLFSGTEILLADRSPSCRVRYTCSQDR